MQSDESINIVRDNIISLGIPIVIVGDAPVTSTIDCVSLQLNDGYGSTKYFGDVAIKEPLIEVIIRNKLYEIGSSWYDDLYDYFDEWYDQHTGVISCVVVGSPGYLGRNVHGFHEWHLILHLNV